MAKNIVLSKLMKRLFTQPVFAYIKNYFKKINGMHINDFSLIFVRFLYKVKNLIS